MADRRRTATGYLIQQATATGDSQRRAPAGDGRRRPNPSWRWVTLLCCSGKGAAEEGAAEEEEAAAEEGERRRRCFLEVSGHFAWRRGRAASRPTSNRCQNHGPKPNHSGPIQTDPNRFLCKSNPNQTVTHFNPFPPRPNPTQIKTNPLKLVPTRMRIFFDAK